MNSLLIYNRNVANQLAIDFKKQLGTTYNFQIGKQELLNPDFSVDDKINTILLSEIENKKYNAIFIPFSLSDDNYIEFIGLRFAFHIRLTPDFNNVQTPILFYGFDRAEEVNKLTNSGSILYSKNVFTTDKISTDSFRKQIEYVSKQHKEIDNIDFIKHFLIRNIVSPSGNYATHHSITNEWSIYRWAKALKIENDQINQINKTIGSNLYFKYLKAKYPVIEVTDTINRLANWDRGRILFIDDEIEKGWGAIFENICQGWDIVSRNILREKIKYESFGAEFKNWDTQTIMDKTIEKVKAFNPDVVILDFRLHDDDFEVAKPEQVTGYKLLKQIKEINQGIQVIILSATNKIWNLIDLQKAGADGFIMKESPELSIDEDYSKNALRRIYEEINDKLGRKFLKTIFSSIQEIRHRINLTTYPEDFREELKNQFQLFWNMIINANTDIQFAYSYITLYMVIELINKQLIQNIDDKWGIINSGMLLDWYWDKTQNEYKNTGVEVIGIKPPEWQKMAGLYFQKWQGTDHQFIRNISSFITKRNGFVHNDRNILDRQHEITGKYVNHDIYTPKGILSLFETIVNIINLCVE